MHDGQMGVRFSVVTHKRANHDSEQGSIFTSTLIGSYAVTFLTYGPAWRGSERHGAGALAAAGRRHIALTRCRTPCPALIQAAAVEHRSAAQVVLACLV